LWLAVLDQPAPEVELDDLLRRAVPAVGEDAVADRVGAVPGGDWRGGDRGRDQAQVGQDGAAAVVGAAQADVLVSFERDAAGGQAWEGLGQGPLLEHRDGGLGMQASDQMHPGGEQTSKARVAVEAQVENERTLRQFGQAIGVVEDGGVQPPAVVGLAALHQDVLRQVLRRGVLHLHPHGGPPPTPAHGRRPGGEPQATPEKRGIQKTQLGRWRQRIRAGASAHPLEQGQKERGQEGRRTAGVGGSELAVAHAQPHRCRCRRGRRRQPARRQQPVALGEGGVALAQAGLPREPMEEQQPGVLPRRKVFAVAVGGTGRRPRRHQRRHLPHFLRQLAPQPPVDQAATAATSCSPVPTSTCHRSSSPKMQFPTPIFRDDTGHAPASSPHQSGCHVPKTTLYCIRPALPPVPVAEFANNLLHLRMGPADEE